jgi:hypothetical protein
MPNKDKTGPEGKGPMTGRGLGKCKGKAVKKKVVAKKKAIIKKKVVKKK